MPENSADQPAADGLNVTAGMPIYDAAGEMVGHVSEYGLQWPHLIMQKGHIFREDVYIPVGAIQRADATGVYLSLTGKEVHALDVDGWSTLGDVDLDTGTPADTQLGAADVPDGNTIADNTTDTSGWPTTPQQYDTGHP